MRKLQSFLKKYENDLKNMADMLRDKTMPELTQELFVLFETTGNRLKYEQVYFERRKFLSVFAASSYFFKRREDIDKLEKIIDEICKEECWALPAHVNRSEDCNWRITIDLFAAETAQTLAEITEILNDCLNCELKQKIKQEVSRRVLNPFLSSAIPYAGWEHNYSNWNAVCGGSVGFAASVFIEDEKEKMACIHRIIDSVNSYYLNGFEEDGACMEGLSYWSYGFYYYVMFADRVRDMTGGKIDLLEGTKLNNIALFQQKCYFSNGYTLSFSDGDKRERYRIGLTAYLVLYYNKKPKSEKISFPELDCAAGFGEDACWRWAGLYRDILWTRRLLEEMEQRKGDAAAALEGTKQGCEIFADAQWAIWHEKEKQCSAAIKGGNNGEPHNHNDVGSFIYLAGKDIVLTDLGAGEYTKDYFGEKRYSVFCNSSESHNVPVIEGMYQKEGREFQCSHFETFSENGVRLDFALAYGNPKLKSAVREFWFDKKTGSVAVEDCFETTEPTEITENLVTQLPVFVEDNSVVFRLSDGRAILSVMGLQGQIDLKEKIHINHKGEKEWVTLIQWKLPTKEKVQSRFSVCLQEMVFVPKE